MFVAGTFRFFCRCLVTPIDAVVSDYKFSNRAGRKIVAKKGPLYRESRSIAISFTVFILVSEMLHGVLVL